jgi:hypothetical protein
MKFSRDNKYLVAITAYTLSRNSIIIIRTSDWVINTSLPPNTSPN